MTKIVSRKRIQRQHFVVPSETCHVPRRRWRILPPEVIHIILELLKDDKSTLRACSMAARDFSQPALSHIGRHITLNYVPRIKLCTQLLAAHSAFQHVRSLDLGITSKTSNPGDYLEEQFAILDIFAQRQTLTRLWLSRIPFPSFEPDQRGKIRDMVAAFGSSVNDLGLYECQFLSRVDMISFILAFPLCDSLYVRDCVAGGDGSAGNMFSGLPKHKLSLDALELTSTPTDQPPADALPIIDTSSLIEDAALDVSKLTVLICNVESATQATSVAMATSNSPVQYFQLGCAEAGGFQVFLNPLSKMWSLEYLTIRPLAHRTDLPFWQDAFRNFPTLPRLRELTLTVHYPRSSAFDMTFWTYMDGLIGQNDIFPRSMHVDIRVTFRSVRPRSGWASRLFSSFNSLRRSRVVKLWGNCYWR